MIFRTTNTEFPDHLMLFYQNVLRGSYNQFSFQICHFLPIYPSGSFLYTGVLFLGKLMSTLQYKYASLSLRIKYSRFSFSSLTINDRLQTTKYIDRCHLLLEFAGNWHWSLNKFQVAAMHFLVYALRFIFC